jgi:hypothetical protein
VKLIERSREMKKLQTGSNNPKLWKVSATCSSNMWRPNPGQKPCGALWEVNNLDLVARTSTDISGSSDVSYGFICPDCGCFTELTREELKGANLMFAREYNEVVNKHKEV